jgi:broad specificity phosphatase PhoE
MSDRVVLAYFGRHGTTELNAKNCYRGMSDVSLDAAGCRDARAMAKFFESIDLCRYVIMSDMTRTEETLRIINEERAEHGLPALIARPTSSLRPLDVGDLSGQPRSKENQAIIEYHAAHPDISFPGGASLNEFRARVRPVINQAVELAQTCHKPVLVLGHSSIVHEVGQVVEGDHKAVVVRPGGIAALYWDAPAGKFGASVALKPDTEWPKRRGDLIS